jgi:hypothetical protein
MKNKSRFQQRKIRSSNAFRALPVCLLTLVGDAGGDAGGSARPNFPQIKE